MINNLTSLTSARDESSSENVKIGMDGIYDRNAVTYAKIKRIPAGTRFYLFIDVYLGISKILGSMALFASTLSTFCVIWNIPMSTFFV